MANGTDVHLLLQPLLVQEPQAVLSRFRRCRKRVVEKRPRNTPGCERRELVEDMDSQYKLVREPDYTWDAS